MKTITRKADYPPLEKTEFTEADPESGAEVKVTRYRRGALAIESRRYSSFGQWARDLCVPSRVRLERMCEQLRCRLEEAGLPTDKTPDWIRKRGGDWEARSAPIDTSEPLFAYQLWTKRLEQLTEPLTDERAAGELLWDVTQLLNRKGIDEHLWHVEQTMRSFASLRMLGPINSAAADGIAARKARAAGPASRRERAKAVRDVIGKRALHYWLVNPILRNEASNTARSIASGVNAELRKSRLLPLSKKGLSAKTIADHIRALMRDKSSGLANTAAGLVNSVTRQVD